MPAHTVEVTPFIRPCPGDQRRLIECGDGVVVGEIIRELATMLHVQPRSLSLVKELGTTPVVLHGKEAPPAQAHVKGVRSLSSLPSKIEVKASAMPTSFSKEEALAIQQDTLEHYEDELVRLQLKYLQEDLIEKWRSAEKLDQSATREYTARLRGVLQPQQAKFFPKHGFEATSKGMAMMQGLFNKDFGDDEEVQANVNKINAVVGTDFAWIPDDLQSRIFAPTPAAETLAIEPETPADIEASEIQE